MRQFKIAAKSNSNQMRQMKKSLGIIGFGQFAQFIVPYLKSYFGSITVSSLNNKNRIARRLDVKLASNNEAAQKDVVMLAVPISEIKNVLKEIQNKVKPNAIITDVCSVKVYPVKLMRKMLPKNVNIIGAHPLFGPQSGKYGIKDLEMVLCPIRINKKLLKEIKGIFSKMGLKVVLTTPEKHDKIMASTQALTHFFAQGVFKNNFTF